MKEYLSYKSIVLSTRLQNDLELIMNGGFYPLTGFMTETEYNCVLEKIELPCGSIFSLPINLYVSENVYQEIKQEKKNYTKR